MFEAGMYLVPRASVNGKTTSTLISPPWINPKGIRRIRLDLPSFVESVWEKQKETENVFTTYPPSFDVIDLSTRISLWKSLFGDVPLPEIEDDAVEKYHGVLNKYLPTRILSPEAIKEALEEVESEGEE